MIRREFLITAGVTVAAVSILGPAVWAEDGSGPDVEAFDSPGRATGWMHGYTGGCASAIGPEPVVPMWITA